MINDFVCTAFDYTVPVNCIFIKAALVKDWKSGTCCFPGLSVHHLRPRAGLVSPVSV